MHIVTSTHPPLTQHCARLCEKIKQQRILWVLFDLRSDTFCSWIPISYFPLPNRVPMPREPVLLLIARCWLVDDSISTVSKCLVWERAWAIRTRSPRSRNKKSTHSNRLGGNAIPMYAYSQPHRTTLMLTKLEETYFLKRAVFSQSPPNPHCVVGL